MIEETACVVSVEPGSSGYVWIEPRRKSSCNICTRNEGCGSASLAELFSGKPVRVKALDTIGSQVGEWVIVGIDERALVKGSFAVYAMPLVVMILMATFASTIFSDPAFREMCSIIFGLAGLGAGIAWSGYFAHKVANDNHYQPVILRRVTPENVIF
jgi:sigma-E factor negative regulatory protein RseC